MKERLADVKASRPWFDSSIVHFAAGCIGYRWAVKVLRYVAKEPRSVNVDTLFFTEIIERYPRQTQSEEGLEIYSQVRKIFNNEMISTVDVEDFLTSADLFKKYNKVAPRLLLRLALMKRNSCSEYLATFATGIEHAENIERVNFMDRIA